MSHDKFICIYETIFIFNKTLINIILNKFTIFFQNQNENFIFKNEISKQVFYFLFLKKSF